MADPLSLLREYTIEKKEIIEQDDLVIFGDYCWPKTVETNYRGFSSAKEGNLKYYYTLETVLTLLKNARLKHPDYVTLAGKEDIPVVRFPDRKNLLAYLNGKIDKSDKIDKDAPVESPTMIEQPADDEPENDADEKPPSEGSLANHTSNTATPAAPSKRPTDEPLVDAAKKRRLETLERGFEHSEEWSITDDEAQAMHRKIAECIVLDTEPFAIVERPGFRRLIHHMAPQYSIPSRQFIAEFTTGTLYEEVKAQVATNIVIALSTNEVLTVVADVWTADDSPSFLTLTLHWINENWQREHVMLNVLPFDQAADRGGRLTEKIIAALELWGIKIDDIHLLLRDNAANINNTGKYSNIDSRICFVHKLQQVIREGIDLPEEVRELVAKARRIVGHFKSSATASSRLQTFQQSRGCPEHCLIQDDPTQWDSTYYMVKRLAEQERALIAYNSAHKDLPCFIYNDQWGLLKRLANFLSHFERFSKRACFEDASVGDVIPALAVIVKALRRQIEKERQEKGKSSFIALKAKVLASLTSCFYSSSSNSSIEQDKKYVLATTLDPRYKTKCFHDSLTPNNAKLWLTEEVNAKLQPEDNSSDEETDSAAASAACNEKNIAVIENYLSSPLLPRDSCPLQYWKEQSEDLSCWPLPELARKFLGAPVTSAHNERLLSLAGGDDKDRRPCLFSENSEELLFIKCNMHLQEK